MNTRAKSYPPMTLTAAATPAPTKGKKQSNAAKAKNAQLKKKAEKATRDILKKEADTPEETEHQMQVDDELVSAETPNNARAPTAAPGQQVDVAPREELEQTRTTKDSLGLIDEYLSEAGETAEEQHDGLSNGPGASLQGDAEGVFLYAPPTTHTEAETSAQKLARINAYLKGTLPDSPRPVQAPARARQGLATEAAKRSGITTTHTLSPIPERSSPSHASPASRADSEPRDDDIEEPTEAAQALSPDHSATGAVSDDDPQELGQGVAADAETFELDRDTATADGEEAMRMDLDIGEEMPDNLDDKATLQGQQRDDSLPPQTPVRKAHRSHHHADPPSPFLSPDLPAPSTLPSFKKKSKKADATTDDPPTDATQSPPWLIARKASRSKGKATETKRKRTDSPERPDPTGPEDLLAQARAAAPKPPKKAKTGDPDAARVPHKHSLDGPLVHDKSTLNQKLRESMRRTPAPLPRHPALRPTSQASGSGAHPHAAASNPAGPAAIEPQSAATTTTSGPPPSQTVHIFSPVPPGGYADIEGPSPGWAYDNMTDASIAYYGKKKSGKVVGIMYGYTFAEAQSALGGTSVAGVACSMIASHLHIDVRTLKTANPVPIPNLTHPRNGPWGVLVYGLSKAQEANLTERKCLATEGVALLLLAVTPHLAKHQVNLHGPYNKEAKTIRILVHKKLRLPENRAALADIARRALPDDARSDRQLTRDIINSVVVTRLESHAKGGQEDPSYNVALPPLCDDITIWHEINDLFRRIDYSCEYSTVLVKERMRCTGCHGVDHYGGLCTYDKSEHWDGPPAGVVAMAEAAARQGQGSANRGRRNYH